jgi:uncharacterized secreted repeat protein (TIGR03808 family)
MSQPGPNRRTLLSRSIATLIGAPAIAVLGTAADAREPARSARTAGGPLLPDSDRDQTAALQAALDRAVLDGRPMLLPPGRFRASGLHLRAGLRMSGAGSRSVIVASGSGPALVGEGAHEVQLRDFRVEGGAHHAVTDPRAALLELRGARDVVVEGLIVVGGNTGLLLKDCSGRVSTSLISGCRHTGLFSLDGAGVDIAGNTVRDCGDNGILVWRSVSGADGTRVTNNRISGIAASSGGSGQNGNGINVFRADAVMVSGNRITDAAYSAVRANASSNISIIGNTAERIGEVALYAEFGFQGALIANNIVDGAATGISVTNFNEGGRLAVIQGNLIRNLHRREYEAVDRRGEGITVEADAAVSGNTIEGAATAGIVIGWGRYMRDMAVTSNVVRTARVGIMVTSDAAAGHCLIAQNLISGAQDGAIRKMAHGRPVGPDLIGLATSDSRILVRENVVTGASG